MSLQNDSSGFVYLTVNDLYNINEEVTGGNAYVRDKHLLQSAIRRPFLQFFGQEQFPTLIDKAAAILHSLAYHHLFADGNKRTALRAVTLFLESNGVTPKWDTESEETFILEVAQGQHGVEEIAEWLRENTAND